MKQEQTHYYLIGNEIKKGGLIPKHEDYDDMFSYRYAKRIYIESLQPCSITDIELDKLKNHIKAAKKGEPIEVTDIITDNNGVVTFREVEESDEMDSDNLILTELKKLLGSEFEYHTRSWNIEDIEVLNRLAISIAKSDAAKQYHSSEPVDLETLFEKFEHDFVCEKYFKELVFNWFIPYLQQPSEDLIPLQKLLDSIDEYVLEQRNHQLTRTPARMSTIECVADWCKKFAVNLKTSNLQPNQQSEIDKFKTLHYSETTRADILQESNQRLRDELKNANDRIFELDILGDVSINEQKRLINELSCLQDKIEKINQFIESDLNCAETVLEIGTFLNETK
jgi:hypothetical protein